MSLIRMHRFSISIAIILQLFLISCRQTGNKQEIVEARFNVDQQLLDIEPLEDDILSFEMQYPREWVLFEEPFREQLAEKILVGTYAPARIVGGVMHPLDSSMLIILDVSKVDSTYFSDLRENYQVLLNQDQRWLDVQVETFSHHCFIVDQYVLQNERIVQFRLQCKDKSSTSQHPRLEIYFFLNRNTLNNNIKSVESSIGTLNCLN